MSYIVKGSSKTFGIVNTARGCDILICPSNKIYSDDHCYGAWKFLESIKVPYQEVVDNYHYYLMKYLL